MSRYLKIQILALCLASAFFGLGLGLHIASKFPV